MKKTRPGRLKTKPARSNYVVDLVGFGFNLPGLGSMKKTSPPAPTTLL
jgi:hypothetical protein